MSTLRVLPVLLLTLSLSGCGVRFMYNQLDWLIPWQLRDYVSLDASQQALLETLVLERLDWHCQTQLPVYAQWLREVEAGLQADRADVDWLSGRADEAAALWAILMRQVSADVATILGHASDAQLQELFGNLDARTREQMDRYVNRPDQVLIEERADRMEQRLRRWLGRMNGEQRARIEAWSQGLGLSANHWLENRGRWQAQFRHALTENRGRPDLLEPALEQLLVHPETTWSDEYRELTTAQRQATLSLLADLHRMASDRQRAQLVTRIGNLARDFERLSCPEP